jgi:hypothetical protein
MSNLVEMLMGGSPLVMALIQGRHLFGKRSVFPYRHIRPSGIFDLIVQAFLLKESKRRKLSVPIGVEKLASGWGPV